MLLFAGALWVWAPPVRASVDAPTTRPESAPKAGDCGTCEQKTAELKKKEDQINENTEFLGKNRAYLTMLSPSEASKYLKVEGNVKIILERIDELKRESAALEEDLEKLGCEKCQGEKK
jgi:hypothetical protein